MPFVSVIIPTCNRSDRVIDAIESVLNQSYKDFELIVVDDGSTDGTAARLAAMYQSRFLLIRQENAGVSTARNHGVRQSSGKYLAFLDSDDIWHPDKLRIQVDFHQENPRFRISQTEEYWIRNGRRVNPRQKHKKPAGYIFPQSLHLCTVSPSSVIMEKNLFEETGGFDEDLLACEDYDLWLRITPAYQVGLIEEKLLTKYGGHRDQLSGRFPAMDRFRLYSLCKLMVSGALNNIQEEQVRAVISEKLKVLMLGAEKRGNDTSTLAELVGLAVKKQIGLKPFQVQGKELLLDDNQYSSRID